MNLLDDSDKNGTAHIISWLSNGRGFAIRNKKLFVEKVLPNHFFKDVHFTSFTRKLRRWGFRSNRIGRNQIVYSHQMFIRGDKVSCLQMCPLNNERDVPASSVSRSRAADLLRHQHLLSISPILQEDKEKLLNKNPAAAQIRNRQNLMTQQDFSIMAPATLMLFEGNNPAAPQVMPSSSMKRGDIPSTNHSPNHQAHTMACCSSLITPIRICGGCEMTHLSEPLFATNNSHISPAEVLVRYLPPSSLVLLHSAAPHHLQLHSSLLPSRFVSPSQSYLARAQQEQDSNTYSLDEPFFCTNRICLNRFTDATGDLRSNSTTTLGQRESQMTRSFSGPFFLRVAPSYSLPQQEPTYQPFDINQR